MAGVVGLVVVALVVAIVLVKVLGNSSASASGSANLAPPDVVAAVTGLPMATLDQIGLGTTTERQQLLVSAPIKVSGQSALTSGGKPQVVYVGAEYCPFCAAERWPMVVALSRFGTFTGLRLITSSSTDVYPDTPTFTFYDAHYTSRFVTFEPVEIANRADQPLEQPTATQVHLLDRFDPPSGSPPGSPIPFLFVGGRCYQVGTGYPDTLLHPTGKFGPALPAGDIAGSLTLPGSALGRAIEIEANLLVGAICAATGNHPGSVCDSPVVASAQHLIGTKPQG